MQTTTEAQTFIPRANVGEFPLTEAEDAIIGEQECFRISNLSRVTRWRREREGKFPRRRQISINRVGWLLSEVLAWRKGLAVGLSTTSEAA